MQAGFISAELRHWGIVRSEFAAAKMQKFLLIKVNSGLQISCEYHQSSYHGLRKGTALNVLFID